MGAKFNLEEFGVDRVKYDAAVSYAQEAAKLKIALGRAGVFDQEWDLAFGSPDGHLAVDIAIIEFVAHGWDLARATTSKVELDPELAEVALANARDADDPVRAAGGCLRPRAGGSRGRRRPPAPGRLPRPQPGGRPQVGRARPTLPSVGRRLQEPAQAVAAEGGRGRPPGPRRRPPPAAGWPPPLDRRRLRPGRPRRRRPPRPRPRRRRPGPPPGGGAARPRRPARRRPSHWARPSSAAATASSQRPAWHAGVGEESEAEGPPHADPLGVAGVEVGSELRQLGRSRVDAGEGPAPDHGGDGDDHPEPGGPSQLDAALRLGPGLGHPASEQAWPTAAHSWTPSCQKRWSAAVGQAPPPRAAAAGRLVLVGQHRSEAQDRQGEDQGVHPQEGRLGALLPERTGDGDGVLDVAGGWRRRSPTKSSALPRAKRPAARPRASPDASPSATMRSPRLDDDLPLAADDRRLRQPGHRRQQLAGVAQAHGQLGGPVARLRRRRRDEAAVHHQGQGQPVLDPELLDGRARARRASASMSSRARPRCSSTAS